ncbi:hypothetical protein VaNZ11_011190 [Volvox africanus]|uniref:Uncharacterized protein n=1 Tax=Volvox africanus TaxID=51714 RepID=A0ABQ5SAV2_9CHLO|nr:hypothetical protein VaNZ11_011190 [Volvox africanus]
MVSEKCRNYEGKDVEDLRNLRASGKRECGWDAIGNAGCTGDRGAVDIGKESYRGTGPISGVRLRCMRLPKPVMGRTCTDVSEEDACGMGSGGTPRSPTTTV